MTDTPFPKAVRSATTTLAVFAGSSGSGKTYSALRYATGLARALGKRVLVIDSENGRALHYAEMFDFDHAPLVEPFRPSTYGKVIEAAVKSGVYGVLVVDQFSHEFNGPGGLTDWHDEILDAKVERARQKEGDSFKEWAVRDALSVGAWSEPKTEHKKFMQWLLQLPVHIVLCARAEEKIEYGKDKNGKTEIRAASSKPGSKDGWVPILEKGVIFEATYSFLFLWTNPGVPIPIKLQEQHRKYFPLDTAITEESGEGIAAWAKGAGSKTATLTLDQVLRAFDAAPDKAALEKAWPLTRTLSQEDRDEATKFYKARGKELKK